MKFLCLCPTYGRPRHLIENTLKCFLDQTHNDAFLIMLDDLGNIAPERGDRWQIFSTVKRAPTLAHKYGTMIGLADTMRWDAIAPWDDDDLYLPKHLEYHDRILQDHRWSQPRQVWSTYTGGAFKEPARGKFWAAIAVTRKLLDEVGGIGGSRNMEYDQEFVGRCKKAAGPAGDPCDLGNPQFCFRWQDTRAHHVQWLGNDPDWYAKVPVTTSDRMADILPKYDPDAIRVLKKYPLQDIVE